MGINDLASSADCTIIKAEKEADLFHPILKGIPSKDRRWLQNVEHMQTFPCAGFRMVVLISIVQRTFSVLL